MRRRGCGGYRSPMKRMMGLTLFSAGCGMLLVLIIPWWGFLAALILVIVGGYLLFVDPC